MIAAVMRRAVIELGLAALLGACGREGEPAGAGLGPDQAAGPARGAVVDLQGSFVDPLAGDAPATVLVFVSTHCPIANRYAPTVRALAQGWQARGVAAWLVYPDPDDDAAAIAAHQAEHGLALPTVRDPEHQLVARAGVRVTPEAAVWQPGAAAAVWRGRIDDRAVELGKVRPHASAHDLRDAVDAVLHGRTPAPAGGPAIGCYISDLR
jgi:AhpC/TSA family